MCVCVVTCCCDGESDGEEDELSCIVASNHAYLC